MNQSPRPLIAGNWKMNGLREETVVLLRALIGLLESGPPACDLLVCPPATVLATAAALLEGSVIALGGQDCHWAPSGAHTGDLSAPMLADAGCRYVILGHSERRTDHHEGDALVRRKAAAAHRAGLATILCVGETEAERDAGRTLAVVAAQLAGSIPEGAAAANTIIAYEPVWAIGTGRTPTEAQVAEVHGLIRRELSGKIGDPQAVRILYGGSMKPGNARALLALPDVNGGLIGGASLKAEDFWAIARSC